MSANWLRRVTGLDVRRQHGSYLLLAQNLKVASSQVQMAWPARARMGYSAPQRAVQLSGGSKWRTNASAMQRDEIWNHLCCAVRRITSAPECTSTPSNWKNESTNAMEPGCGPCWTSRSSRSTLVWPSGQSGLRSQRPWWSRGKINHHFLSA